MDYQKLYQEWVSDSYFDENTKEELKAIAMMRMRSRNVFIRIWNSVQQV